MYLSNEGVIMILLVGLIAGWLAGKIVRGTGIGLIGDMAIGIVGAFIASWLLPRLGIGLGAGLISGDHQCHHRRSSVADNHPARSGITSTVGERAYLFEKHGCDDFIDYVPAFSQ